MAFTYRGFAGGPLADIDFGIGISGGYWAESAAALQVTQPNTATRTLSVAAGNGAAFGIRVFNDAPVAQVLTAPGSGGAWFLIALRYNWSSKTVSLQVIAGATTGGTNNPGDIPALPGSNYYGTPGTIYDQPLAWAFVNSANTTVNIYDVRMLRYLNGPLASNGYALRLLGQQFTPPAGFLIPSLAEQSGYRWNGTVWKQWDSDWQDFTNGMDVSGPASGPKSKSSRYRYQGGIVEFTGTFVLSPGGMSSSPSILLPTQIDQAAGYRAVIGEVVAINASDNGRPYDLRFIPVSSTRIEARTNGGGSISNPGAMLGASGTAPFNEAWAEDDFIDWRFRYSPA